LWGEQENSQGTIVETRGWKASHPYLTSVSPCLRLARRREVARSEIDILSTLLFSFRVRQKKRLHDRQNLARNRRMEEGNSSKKPVSSSSKETLRNIPILYATSRKWNKTKGEFGHKRGGKGKNSGLQWGQLNIILRGGEGRKEGEIVQYGKRRLNGSEVTQLLKGNQVVVFLHGFNSSFQDAAVNYAKLIEQFFLVTNEKKIEKGMMRATNMVTIKTEKDREKGGLVFVLYSWPSFGESGISSDEDKAPFYWKDDQIIKEEVKLGHIHEFLDTLRKNSSSTSPGGQRSKKEKKTKGKKEEKKKKQKGVEQEEREAANIDIIAHDLGGKLLFSALKHCSSNLLPIHRISFFATEVKKHAIRKHFNNRISKKCVILNNYYCRKDRSLHLAEVPLSKKYRNGGKGGKGGGGAGVMQKLIGQSYFAVEGPNGHHIFNIRVPSELAKEVSKDMHSYFLSPPVACDLALQFFSSSYSTSTSSASSTMNSPKDRRLLPVMKTREEGKGGGIQKGWKIPYQHDEPTTLPGVIEYLQKELGDQFALVEKHLKRIKLASFITGNGKLLPLHNHQVYLLSSLFFLILFIISVLSLSFFLWSLLSSLLESFFILSG
jgi:hypothetical protein